MSDELQQALWDFARRESVLRASEPPPKMTKLDPFTVETVVLQPKGFDLQRGPEVSGGGGLGIPQAVNTLVRLLVQSDSGTLSVETRNIYTEDP